MKKKLLRTHNRHASVRIEVPVSPFSERTAVVGRLEGILIIGEQNIHAFDGLVGRAIVVVVEAVTSVAGVRAEGPRKENDRLEFDYEKQQQGKIMRTEKMPRKTIAAMQHAIRTAW